MGELTGGLFRNSVSLLQNFDKAAYTVQALGEAEIAISDPARNLQVKLYLDSATNLILKKEFTAAIMGPPADTEEAYSDYRDVAGVKLPFKTVLTQSGKKKVDQTTAEIKINPGLADTAYKKPGS
jgi:hypothetical protein